MKSQVLLIEVCWLRDEDPFVSGAWGHVTIEDMQVIEQQCRSDVGESFPNGNGVYLFSATWDGGDECHRGYFDLTLIRYEAL